MYIYCIYKACMVIYAVYSLRGNINFYHLLLPSFTHACGYIGMAVSTSGIRCFDSF